MREKWYSKQSYAKGKAVRNPRSSNRKSTSLSKLWQRYITVLTKISPSKHLPREALYHRWYPSLLRETPCAGKPIATVLFNTNRRRKTGISLANICRYKRSVFPSHILSRETPLYFYHKSV